MYYNRVILYYVNFKRKHCSKIINGHYHGFQWLISNGQFVYIINYMSVKNCAICLEGTFSMWLRWTFAIRWLVTVFHLKYLFIYIQWRLIYFNSRYSTFHSIFILLFMFQSRLFLGLHIEIPTDVYIPFRHMGFFPFNMSYNMLCSFISLFVNIVMPGGINLFEQGEHCYRILCSVYIICLYVTEFYAPCIYFVNIFIHTPCIFCVYFIHIKCYFNNVMFLICRYIILYIRF